MNWPGRDESGAVAVIVAIVLSVLLLVSAIVVDLGALRADHVSGKAIADMAASSAAVDYEPDVPGSPREACLEALDYAVANLRAEGTPTAIDACESVYASDYVCNPNDALYAEYTLEAYQIVIAVPVFWNDDDPNDLRMMGGFEHDLELDGDPCERIGVRITRDRSYLLAGITGIDGGTTSPASVARLTSGREGEFASLIVLQREGCETIRTQGNTDLRVNRLETGGDVYQGIVSVDTLDSGCSSQPNSNNKVFRTGGGSLLWADGEIRAFNLLSNDPGNTYTFTEGAVGTSEDDPDALWPRPGPGDLVTRAQLDHRYNCREGYSEIGVPIYEPSDPIEDCAAYDADDPDPRYIRDLHEWLANDAHAPGTPPAGDWYLGHVEHPDICDQNAGTIAIDGVADDATHIYINCSGELRPDNLVITNAEYVVLNGTVRLLNDGHSLSINDAAGQPDAVLVLRDGNIRRTGGHLRLRDVFVYLKTGYFDMTGGDGSTLLKGPDKVDEGADPEDCMTSGSPSRPTASCFGPLALWANGAADNEVGGGAQGGVIGTVFTPNARTVVRGGVSVDDSACTDIPTWGTLASAGSMNLEGAQFFASRINLAGGGGIRMCPNPELLPDLTWTTSLIR